MEKESREKNRKLYPLFAEILEYPTYSFYECFDECVSLLMGWDGEAAHLLKKFEPVLARMPLGDLQETYTRTFGLQPVWYPYVGYHLFGENHRRGLFMSELKKHYLSHGFAIDKELPDHLAVILRFLAQSPVDEEKDMLVHECMILALETMLKGEVKEEDNPYRAILRALLLMLEKEKARGTAQSAQQNKPGRISGFEFQVSGS
jgi:nitrate reductase molybdenum cofactor assembly chaperone NarJ/NarW